jgi:nucleoside-diphosphate-sugar epimerase
MGNTNIKVAVVGTGVIGAGWATHFLAQGFEVAATDPAAGAEARLREWVDDYWPTVEALGLVDGASRDKLCFMTNLAQAVRDAVFIQESPSQREWARDLGKYPATDDYIQQIAQGVAAELEDRDFPELLRQRDELLVHLLAAKKTRSQIP